MCLYVAKGILKFTDQKWRHTKLTTITQESLVWKWNIIVKYYGEVYYSKGIKTNSFNSDQCYNDTEM